MIGVAPAGAVRLWLVVAGAAMIFGVLTLAGYLAYGHGRMVERAGWQARWSDRDASEQKARGDAESAARTEEQRRQTAINQVANDARKEQALAIDDGARADAAGDRLHVAAQDLASRASCAAGDAGATERSETARRAALVLSDLLSRTDARAGELAKAYDRARIAGLACESAYSSLSAAHR